MSQLDRTIGGTITADSTTTSRPGYGTPCFMAFHTKNADPLRTYGDSSSMLSDGFALTDAAYRMVASAFEQNPRPVQVKLGRMTTAVADRKTLTVKTFVQGSVLSVTITDAAGVVHVITRTVPSSSSLAAEATAVAALIAAITGVASAVAVGAVITVTITTAGDVWYYSALSNLDVQDTCADAAVDTDLANILLVDSDFYGVACAVKSKANIDKISAWCEANVKFYVAHTADSVEKQTGNSVIGADIKGKAYTHTWLLWSGDTLDYPGCAMLGKMLPKDPGSAAWSQKTLAGVSPDKLSDTEIAALEAAGFNYYITISGRNVTRLIGAVASGEKADIIIGTDWLQSEIKADVFDLFATEDKVDFDDAGVAKVKNIIYGKLEVGVTRRFLEAGNGDDVPFPLVTAPRVSTIATSDRANRHLPDVKFSAQLRGAINSVTYAGTLSV